jgi:hypothetical protein
MLEIGNTIYHNEPEFMLQSKSAEQLEMIYLRFALICPKKNMM